MLIRYTRYTRFLACQCFNYIRADWSRWPSLELGRNGCYEHHDFSKLRFTSCQSGSLIAKLQKRLNSESKYVTKG